MLHRTTDCRKGTEVGARSRTAPYALSKIGVIFENNPKASVCYSLGSDTVSSIGEVEIVTDIREKMKFDDVCDRRYFKNGIADPKCYLLRFRPNEATFWIEGKFRTCKYKVNK